MMATIAKPENLVYQRPQAFTEFPTHYCPGCTHGVAHRLIAEVLDEMDVTEKTIGVAPVSRTRARASHGDRCQACIT
jgi:2-oxoglutarate ferredoxin oxidoreductase subunit beta